jgi:hypothetical protein
MLSMINNKLLGAEVIHLKLIKLATILKTLGTKGVNHQMKVHIKGVKLR